uniref:Mediator of RNA polymerase II transcription subunit 30 n=1 Tax=Ictidomys tridecemlineatus TaxID=43179 RepID=I3LX31_ICTTR
MSTPPLAASGMAPGPFAGPQAQQAAREVNTASLCRIGQETVQDIVYRTMEIFQLLRNMQVGVRHGQLAGCFWELRNIRNENCPLGFQLIPYVEEEGSKNDDRAGLPRFASEERREIAEVNKKLKQKNQQLKQIMDQLRNLIWDINAMLAMRN